MTVGSCESMGSAGGTCECTGARRIKIREDIMRTGGVVAELVVTHELIHRKRAGNHSEGITHLEAIEAVGADPIGAYSEEVRAAKTLGDLIGREAMFNAACSGNAEQRLVGLATRKKLSQTHLHSGTPEAAAKTIQVIVDESRQLVAATRG